MQRIAALSTLAILLLLATPAGLAAPLPTSDPTFEQLQERFQRLHRSLQGRGGMSEEDRPVVESMRERFARFNAQNSEHAGGLAGELQLSMWLEDHDRVDALFAELVRITPDEPRYGVAWIDYLRRAARAERADEVFEWLLENTADTAAIRTSRANLLKRRSDYSAAIAILDERFLDPAKHPDAHVLRAELLYAENRFDEANALLESIPAEALEDRPNLRQQVDRTLRDCREIAELWAEEEQARSADAARSDMPQVELVTARGRIVLELFEDSAPNTVANFITLVEDGFYDNTRFHRVVPEFVTQGGDPYTRPDGEGAPGTGGPGWRIADEWERESARRHFAGSLAMAHSGPDTAGSQFYITHRPTPDLNLGYTVFGRVLEGLDVARQMQVDDELISARVLRKRDHDYPVVKLRTLEEIEEGLPEFLRSR